MQGRVNNPNIFLLDNPKEIKLSHVRGVELWDMSFTKLIGGRGCKPILSDVRGNTEVNNLKGSHTKCMVVYHISYSILVSHDTLYDDIGCLIT